MTARRWQWLVIALAIVVRLVAIFVLQSHTIPRSTYEHGEIAENLVAGRGFSVMFLGADGPTSQQAPLYPALLAGCYAVAGVASPRALLILQIAQAVMGGVMAGWVMAIAREVAPGRAWVATAAGMISACHPTLIYAATHIQVVSMATLLLVGTLRSSYRAGRTNSWRDVCEGGLALGALTLTDPILALVAPGACWAMAIGCGWRRAIRPAVVAGIIAALCVAPWIVRNAVVHGELVFIKSSFGYAFWQGNCALSEGTDKVVRESVERKLATNPTGLAAANRALWDARHEAGYIDDIALSRRDYDEMSRMTEPARSRLLMRRVMAELREDPWRYLRLSARRLRYFVLFDETNPKTRSLVYRVPHLGLTLLAVIGIVAMPRDLRQRMAPTFLAAGLIAAFHTLTIVSARFHIPIEPLMGLWAAGIFARGRPPADQPREPTTS